MQKTKLIFLLILKIMKPIDFEILLDHLQNVLKLELNNEDSSRVCFAFENEELRDDFKISFTTNDAELYLIKIKNYCDKTSSTKDFIINKNSKIPLPKTAELFWNVTKFDTKN